MKYYIIAGEASGDLHGSNLIKEIKILDDRAEFRCWGGDLMKEQGAVLAKHCKELAFMGFVEVLANIRTIMRNIRFCKQDILEFNPDVLVLIDYPGFNLRIAEFAKQQGFKVVYYISPQIWAWKQSRVHKIKRFVDRMIVILPFEKDFYKKFEFNADYVGHPLLDAIEGYKFRDVPEIRNNNEKPLISVLPGSREQEIKKMLPVMMSVCKHFPEYRFLVAAVPSLPVDFYKNLIGDSDARIVYAGTYEMLRASKAAMVTSGTATLETALIGTPEVVCYKGNYLSFRIAKSVVKIKYISLVNLIMDTEVVKELIQQEFTEKNLVKELTKILRKENNQELKEKYKGLREILGGKGASAKAASIVVSESKQ